MADWSKPSLTDPYASVLAELMARDVSSSTLSYSADANIPNGAIRWNPVTNQFETYSASGGNWSVWTQQLNIGTLLVGQNAAPNTMQAVPRQQSDALYQPVGSYAQLIGSKTQPFFAANATDPQQSTPLNQTQALISAAVGPLGGQFAPKNGSVGSNFSAATLYSTNGIQVAANNGAGFATIYSDTVDCGGNGVNDLVVATGPADAVQYSVFRADGQFCPSQQASLPQAAATWGQVQNWANDTFATPGGVNQQITNAVLNPATAYGAAGNSSGNGSCSTSISFTAPCNGRIVVNGSGKCSSYTQNLWFSAANGTGGWCPVVSTVQGGSGYLSPVAIIDGVFGVGSGAQVYLQLSIQGGGSSQVGFIWKFHPTA